MLTRDCRLYSDFVSRSDQRITTLCGLGGNDGEATRSSCCANLLFDTGTTFFTGETLKSFLFGAAIDKNGLHDCYLLPVKTGVNVPPALLSCLDPQWNVICEDLLAHSRAFGTQLHARQETIEVRSSN